MNSPTRNGAVFLIGLGVVLVGTALVHIDRVVRLDFDNSLCIVCGDPANRTGDVAVGIYQPCRCAPR
jgi:hypothetical protein